MHCNTNIAPGPHSDNSRTNGQECTQNLLPPTPTTTSKTNGSSSNITQQLKQITTDMHT